MIRFLLILALALPLPVATPAMAKDEAPEWEKCTTSVEGQEVELNFIANDPQVKENSTFRERWRGEHAGISCPAFITLRYLTPELENDEQREPFCLIWDKEKETYGGYAEGSRDSFSVCEKPSGVCRRVNDTAESAALMTGLKKPDGDMEKELKKHSSGATIFTGSDNKVAEWIGKRLKDSATSALGAAASTVSAPAAAAAAAVTLVAVGGAVYICREK